MAKLNQVEQLKLNVTNIHSFLVKSNKDKKKLNTEKKNREKRKLSFEKQKEEEKLLLKKEPKNKKSAEQVVQLSSMSLLDKLFNFGGLLLGGILVNAANGIVKEGKKFYADNKELFDTIGGFLSGVKDAAVGLFDSFTGPYAEEGAFDDFAKFDDSGKLQSGTLKKVEDAYNGFGDLINTIDKALGGKGTAGNFLKTDTTPSREELVKQTERGSGMSSFREDAAENAALQRSVMGESSGPSKKVSGSLTGTKEEMEESSPGSPGQYGPLFEVISRGEGGVNSVNRGNAGDTPGGAKSIFGRNLTDMTVDEIYAAQRSGRVFAVGKFQIIDITMPGFIKYLKSRGIDTSTAKFTEKIQDYFKPYVVDYKRPIVGKYLRGESNNRAEAAQALAREFASIGASYPETIPGYQPADRGDTLYGGRGNNRASISPAKIEAALDAAKITPKPKITPVPDKGNQARVLNRKDPRKKKNSTIIAVQRVNTKQIVPLPTPVPVKSKSSFSSASQPQLSPLWA